MLNGTIYEQAADEAKAMQSDLDTAQTLEDLDQLYVNWVGYSLVEDDPTQTVDTLRGMLSGYLAEFRASVGLEVPA